MDIAEAIVRSRGYNAFSYSDIASEIGVSKASLHHHFPTKSDLGLKLVERFTDMFSGALQQVDEQHSSCLIKLREYARLHEGSLQENKMCLCGMLAAEHETLSQSMQDAINGYFDGHEHWIKRVLLKGRSDGELAFKGDAGRHAKLIASSLQGALMIAKSKRSMDHITAVSSQLIDSYRAI
ncbi:MAG: TetR/AcrR family transcriptional regulator [Alphaproteobacteria bacterium]|nr:TetR/AcrR family transcriptional regulator [Alphaproteobacteria bacterium]